jgi:rod shape-determining protein MreC
MRITAPVRAAAQRLTLPLLIFLSALLAILGKADVVLFDRVRVLVADTVSPVLQVVGQPIAAFSNAVGAVENIFAVYDENQRLKTENERLLQWQEAARRLQSENDQLRDLAKYVPQSAVSSVSGQVIADSGGAYLRNVMINVGRRDGVARGQAAMTGEGLVGRVIEVGDRTARVLLLTDINSHVPVSIEGTLERAMLDGDNGDRPRLVYIQPKGELPDGARVVTSGSGGIFPPGLPVGIVTTSGGRVNVEPYADLARLQILRIVDFGLDGVLPDSAIPGPRALRPPRTADSAR